MPGPVGTVPVHGAKNRSPWARVTTCAAMSRPIERERLRVRAREGQYVPAFDQALVFLDLGDHEAAVAQLERAYAVRDPRLTLVRFGPKYRAIAKHPGVLPLMRAMDLP